MRILVACRCHSFISLLCELNRRYIVILITRQILYDVKEKGKSDGALEIHGSFVRQSCEQELRKSERRKASSC